MDELLEQLLADLQAGTIENTEQLGERIAALPDEAVGALEAQAIELATAIAEGTAELEDGADRVGILNTLADAAEGARNEAGSRFEAAESEANEVQAALDRVRGEQTPPEGEAEGGEGETPPAEGGEGEGETPPPSEETPPAEEPPAETPPPAEAEGEREPVAAGAGNVRTLARAAVRMPADRRPAPSGRADVAIVAAGDLRNHSAGARIPDYEALTAAIYDRADDFRHSRGTQTARIATIEADYPAEQDLRRIGQDNPQAVTAAVNAVIGENGERIQAMAAAGGFCAPPVTLYDQPTVRSSDARPAKGALPSFQATRGRVQWMPAARWTDYSAGVSFWDSEDDVDALTDAQVRKPCVRVDCDDLATAEVYAIPMCVTLGNFFDRTFPERRDGILEGLMAWQSRVAERRLLFNLGAASADVAAGKVLGTARDVIAALNRARAGFNGRWRTDDNFRLEWWAPRWLRLQMIVDIVRQMPAHGTQEEDLAVATATVDRIIAAAGVDVTWLWEAEEGGGAAAQEMSNMEVDGTSLDGWPDTAITYLFPAGVHTFLDAGRIDLGVVRDSTLNEANDLQIWSEGFEGHMYRGPESLRVTLDVCPTGESGATAEIADLICGTGS